MTKPKHTMVPRRAAVLLALLASASNQTLLAALTVGSLNAGLLSSASAATCVTGVTATFANVVSGASGLPGETVVTAVTPAFANAVTGVQTTQTPFLTGATLNPVTGTAVTSVTAPTTPITAIDASSTATTPFNPNLRVPAVDASVSNNSPPAARFAFQANGSTTTNNNGSIVFTNTSNPGLIGPLLTVPFLNGSTVTTPVVTGVTASQQNNFLTSRPLQPIRKDLVIRFRRQRLTREAIMAAKEISVKKYVVRLSGEERERLETLLRKGKSPARRVLKARILLKADVSEAGKGWSDNRIIEALETSPSMVYRVRKQLVEEGFEAVLSRKPRAMPAVARIFDGEKEAKLIALACSKPPKGRARWTLRLLENKVVELGIVDRASDSTIGRALKKTLFSPIAASTGSSRRRPTARS